MRGDAFSSSSVICVSGIWKLYPAMSGMCGQQPWPDSGDQTAGAKRTCRDMELHEEAISTSHRSVADRIQEIKTSGIRNQPMRAQMTTR